MVTELSELIRDGRTAIIGLIRQELLSGVKTAAQFEQLRTRLRTFRDEPLNTDDYEAAAKAGNDCRAKGIAVSVVDMLICVVAIRRNMAVFTNDPDFERYARALPLLIHSVAGR